MKVAAAFRSGRLGDLAACAWLLGLAALLFRHHIVRRLIFLGNPDRVHNNLKLVKFYVDGITDGTGLQAWNEHELLGYDSFALPYINPNPLTYLYAAFGSERLYIAAGYISALLLALAGIGAYFFLRSVCAKRLPAAVGASLYMLSALSVLKVSQNDASYLAFVLMPPLMLALRATRSLGGGWRSGFVQAGLIYLLVQFSFLQKAAYVLLLWGAYAIFLAWSRRDRAYVLIPGIAAIAGIVAAGPRLAGVALAMQEYSRGSADAAEKPIGVHVFELFRWFDSTMFGRFFGDPVWRLNLLNLSEGVLLYTAALVPFAILAGCLGSRRVQPLGGEARFFGWVVASLFAIVTVPWLIELVWLAFGKISFIHARMLIAGLLPLTVLVALHLGRLQPEVIRPLPGLLGAAIGVLMVLGIERVAQQNVGAVSVPVAAVQWLREWFDPVAPVEWIPAAFEGSAVSRVLLSAGAAIGLVLLARRRDALGHASHAALALGLVAQAMIGANFQLNGPHIWSAGVPFQSGNITWVAPDKFRPPSPAQSEALQHQLDNKRYRSAVVCNAAVGGGFCAGHISEFWKLRLVDGYYGVGAPVRIRALPWEGGVGMRDLSFTQHRTPQWPLLGLLNTRSALTFTPGLYGYGSIDDGSLAIARNPAPVVSRAFFAARVEPVDSPQAAASALFAGNVPRDPRATSYVEGLQKPMQSAGDVGKAEVTGHGDRLQINVEAAQYPRFLVLNELYSRRWRAQADGNSLPVYPTNVVMRGVVVPAGATSVTFVYRPVASLANCLIAVLAAAGLALLAIRLLRL